MAEIRKNAQDERWTVHQKGVVALAALVIVFDGFDNQVLGFTTPALMTEQGIAKGAIAPIAAISLIGMSVGTMIAGILGDRIGRHTVPISAVALFGLMTFATGWINGLWQLSALRFLAGLGLGRAMPNAAAIAAVYTQPKKCVFAEILTIVCIPLETLIAGLISRIVLPIIGWRTLIFVAGGLPVPVSLLLMLTLPQSPSFKLGAPPHQRVRLANLFGKEVVRDTVAIGSTFFACLLAVYSVFSWAPTMLRAG